MAGTALAESPLWKCYQKSGRSWNAANPPVGLHKCLFIDWLESPFVATDHYPANNRPLRSAHLNWVGGAALVGLHPGPLSLELSHVDDVYVPK